ncbi:MAG: GerW family sporulation protein [Endomicrobiales bacterium]
MGGGLKITPVSVVCVDDSGVSVFPVGGKRGLLGQVAGLMPQVMEKIGKMKSRSSEKEEKKTG